VDSLIPPPCAAAVLDAGERADDVVDVPVDELLLPHAAATKASGTTSRAGDLTRADGILGTQRTDAA
jgi:hypothetical protein